MSGTLTALGTAALGLGLCVLVAGVGQGAHTAAVASSAADLAALAGADGLRGIDPTGTDACTVAETTAARNGARLVSCAAGASSTVTVTVAVEQAFGADAEATAKAGPPTGPSAGPPTAAPPEPPHASPPESSAPEHTDPPP